MFPKTGQPVENGRSVLVWVRVAVSTILIAAILYFADLSEVLKSLATVQLDWLLVAVLCQLVGPVTISLRWQKLLAAQNITPSWRYLFASTLMSTFFRQFMPSIVGGDVIRVHHAMKAGASPSVAFMSLVVDRLGGLIALLILAIIGTIMGPAISESLPNVWAWIAGAGIVLCLALSIVVFGVPSGGHRPGWFQKVPFKDKIEKTLSKISIALSLYRGKSGVLLYALVMSLILQLNVVIFFWAISMALGMQLSLAVFFVIVPIAIMIMMLPVSINGIGLREGVFIFLLGVWGIPASGALSLAWIEYGIILVFGLLGGIIYGAANMQPTNHGKAMRIKSAIESVLRVSPPLYRLGSNVYHKLNPQFRTLSPGAPGAIRRGFAFSLEDADARAFKGDYYEFGIFRGGTFLEASRIVDDLGCEEAMLYGFDSFEGLPAPEGVDATDTRFFEGQFACSREDVEKNLASNGMDMSRAKLIQGFYEESLTEKLRDAFPFKPVSVALLDCDYYSSTKVALDWLRPYIRPGSVLLFDDWYSYGDTSDLGQPKALADWLAENPEFTTEEFGKFEHNGQGYVVRAAQGR